MEHAIASDLLPGIDIYDRINHKFSVIVLNEDLEVLGEAMLPDYEFDPYSFFVLPDGLYLLNLKKSRENENFICFTQFQINIK